jgi:ribonuclease Z
MEMLNIKNLVMWHTMDNNIPQRKELYTKEAKEYYSGYVFVPNDLDVIEL